MNGNFWFQLHITFLISVALVESRKIYISPSVGGVSHCERRYDSCITLSQFTNASQFVKSEVNLTIIFLPGNHLLNTSNFNVTGIPYVSIRSSSTTSTIESTINCSLSSKFLFKFNTVVNINGLTFNGCFENEVFGVSNFKMEDCCLNGGSNLIGRALVVTNSTLHLKKSYFKSFHGCESYKGGAVYCLQSRISIIDCVFTNNTATSGAALHVEGNSEVTVANSIFSNQNSCFNNYCHGSVRFANGSSVSLSDYVPQCSIPDDKSFNSKGGVLRVIESKVSLHLITVFENTASYGGAVYCNKGANLNISNSNFMFNKATTYGGVIYQLECDVQISESNFSNNEGRLGGILYHDSTLTADLLMIEDSYFRSNRADRGGVTFISKSEVKIMRCQFSYNEAREHGGVLFLTSSTNATITSSNFSDNKASSIGGALRAMNDSRVNIIESAWFTNNSAFYGAAIHLFRADILTMNGTISINGNEAIRGTICIIHSNIQLEGNVSFTENVGSLYAYGSDILLRGIVSFTGQTIKTRERNNNTETKMEGGCISVVLSKIDIATGIVSLSHSTALNGGGLLAITSTVKIIDNELHIFSNNATDTGGGVYLYQSIFYIKGTVNISNNNAVNYGGGIHAISSIIIIHVLKNHNIYSELYLSSNSAQKGGGACLEVNSQFYMTQLVFFERNGSQEVRKPVHLLNNKAEYGGAVYVADETNLGTCSSDYGQSKTITAMSHSECFFQIIAIRNETYKFRDAFEFANNVASTSGPLLFGGLLDRCTMNSFVNGHKTYSSIPGFAESIIDDTSSHPVRICFCSKNGMMVEMCTNEENEVSVMKGETFSLYVVAIDQMNHTINATIYSYLRYAGTVGEDQKQAIIGNTCSELPFTVLSTSTQEELVLYAHGPCTNLGISPLKVRIEFIPCKCPAGFEWQQNVRDSCVCVCHTKLRSLPFMKELKCNSTTLTITRSKPFWVSFENGTFIVYEYCPSDYCVPPLPPVNIDLEISDGVDVQCNFNRTGTLCGLCQEGLTLSLGSSRCIECPHYWPAIFITVVIGSLLAGIALVVLLLISNITVAAGSLNGVIFYVNILSTNQDLFMPFRNLNFHSIFIAWLNLDVGFDVCFVKDMTTYDKTWLQISFPVYLLIVVIAIMIASKYSVRFSRVISPKNPVATLATLILLSYNKLLDTNIAVASYASLSYIPEAEGEQYFKHVWTYDASILYHKGKHIPLCIVSLFIIIVVSVYTLLLLFWQCLVCLPDKAIFKWVRNTKISSFIDAYHAPFMPRNRYWTGLLLLARVILHINSATNKTNPSVNLLCISLVIGCILLIQGYSGIRTYKKMSLNVLEFTSYFNILAFTAAKYYVLLTDGNDTAIAYISISAEFVLFLCVIVYHTATETNIVYRIRHCKLYKIHFCQDLRDPFLSKEHYDLVCNPSSSVTFSEVTLDKKQSKQEQREQEADRTMKEREDATQLFSEEQ